MTEVRRRGMALSRNVVYWSNQLPTPPENNYAKTKQIREAARALVVTLEESLDGDTELARSKLAQILSFGLVPAQAENRVLARFQSNLVDTRRTDRILRELARQIPLDCETRLLAPPLQGRQPRD